MTKKHILMILALILLLAAAVCSLPWPTRVNLSMDAAEVSPDGTVIQEGTLEMQGWILNYLYKPDSVHFTHISILGSEVSNSPEHLPGLPLFSDSSNPDSYTIYSSFYMLNQRRVVSAETTLSKALDWCCLQVTYTGVSHYVVAPGRHDILSILARCS